MTPPRLLIRADAGPAAGIGHVMRMIALGEAWSETGGAVALLGNAPAQLAKRVEVIPLPAEWVPGSPADAALTAATARRLEARWVAADGYGFGEPWQETVRAAARLLVVDDNAENRPYVADCVLNVNAHATEALYAQRAPRTRLLLGLPYVLIRSEIRRARRDTAPVPQRARRWLVTMGGSDPLDVTGRVLEALGRGAAGDASITVLVGQSNPRAYRAPPGVELLTNVDDVGQPMRHAELALTASGGTVWELALLGVPSATLVTADNQAALAGALAARGAVLPLGDARTTPPDRWLAALADLSEDPQRRSQLIRSARELVDGDGAARVVRALREELQRA